MNAGMMSIPPADRPYEKCLRFGAGSLTDSELLAVLLRSGTQQESALELARRILGDERCGCLSGLYHLSAQELMSFHGIGEVKTVLILCVLELSRRLSRERMSEGICFRSPDDIAGYYMEDYRHRETESVLLLMLDTKGKLLAEEEISRGTVNASLVSPREIFISALRRRAVSVVLLHNHPSGDPTPSHDDLLLTGRVKEAGAMLGIDLIDHIIIGDGEAVSLRAEQLI
ncbi:MAG: DNA repair protein RadC [Lachnospiraceae bacterium]|nr:DNA repair protein RadC [Lachnospiraceae bacterium]